MKSKNRMIQIFILFATLFPFATCWADGGGGRAGARAGVRAPRAGVRAPRAGVRAPRAGVRAPRTSVRVPRADVRVPRADVRVPRADVRAPRVDVRGRRSDVRVRRARVPEANEVEGKTQKGSPKLRNEKNQRSDESNSQNTNVGVESLEGDELDEELEIVQEGGVVQIRETRH